jgi:hypothetical protein
MIEHIDFKRPDLKKRVEDIRLVKAAICYLDTVYTGWRHSHILWHMREIGLPRVRQEEQGFIDQFGAFYRRESCSFIALENGQVSRYIDPLTSEDLWDNDGNPLTFPKS